MPQTLPTPWSGHLAAQTHYRAQCWKITRTDGTILRLTSHDRSLAVWIGTGLETFVPGYGQSQVSVERRFGIHEQNLSLRGVLEAAQITHADLRARLYDGARIDLYVVDWRDPIAGPVFSYTLWIGRMKHGPTGWEAEVEGTQRWLKERSGIDCTRECPHALGDASCAVNLATATYTRTGWIVDNVYDSKRYQFDCTAASVGIAPADGWFDYGYVTFTSGNLSGLSFPVKQWLAGTRYFSLDAPTPLDIEPGDELTATAGCDKTFATCKSKFSNGANFNGFPFMTGDDQVKRLVLR